MEWFGTLTDSNAWFRGAFEGSMLAVFVLLAQFENNWIWLAVLVTICVMAGEFRARKKLQKLSKNKSIAALKKLEKRCDDLEKSAHQWKARSLKLQTKMERAGVGL
jgi:hypothetical protein